VIAGLHDSYRLFRPGEIPIVNDVTVLVTRIIADAFRVGIQLSGPFLVFGLVFNVALGVLSRLMPQMQVYFVAVPLSIMIGFLILLVVVGTMMSSFLDYLGGVLRELAPYS
jgi:flagellar biosynthetic protein FliR